MGPEGCAEGEFVAGHEPVRESDKPSDEPQRERYGHKRVAKVSKQFHVALYGVWRAEPAVLGKSRSRGGTITAQAASPSMDEEHDLWALERSLWLGGAEVYERALDATCLAALPGVGIVTAAAAILKSIEEAPRWDEVEMDERQLARPADGIAVLAYRAVGRREGAEPYRTLCTSTYRRDGPRWRLVQHQQTPT